MMTGDHDQARALNIEGVTHAQQGRWDESVAAFEASLRLRPDYAEALSNLGNVLYFQGKLEEAVERYRRAIELEPNSPYILNNLGNSLRLLGDFEEAANMSRRAAQLLPNYAEAHSNLAAALTQQGNLEEAAAACRQALALKPELAEAHNNLGNVLRQQRQFDDAIASCRYALALKPDFAEAHNNLGAALTGANQYADAEAHCREALARKPDLVEALNNLANALWPQGRFDEAEECCRLALQRKPHFAEAYHVLGVVLMKQQRLDAAVQSFDEALRLNPDLAEAHLDVAMALLLAGNFERGWKEYEWRLKCKGYMLRPFTHPVWDGEDATGKTVLILPEQGFGDKIQFIRYARMVKQRCGRVIFACPETLHPLLRDCPGVDEIITPSSSPTFAYLVPVMSLPRAFRTTLDTIPADIPYLKTDDALVSKWRNELERVDGFKIGIAWQGSIKHPEDRHRSIPLQRLAPLAKVPGVRLISLQKGPGSEQVQLAGFDVLELGPRLDEDTGPFLDSAAVMKGLDLVIAADTSLAHLAGALGVPVWVAISYAPDWRWMLERQDTPWYPTMRLFRQADFGDWDSVFEEMAGELARLIGGRPRAVTVMLETAPGELMDKITIAEIKKARIKDEDKLRNVIAELAALSRARSDLPTSKQLDQLVADLKKTNETLWQIEDDIRDCERAGDFGSRFIALARSVYRQNDRRAALKRQISELLGSHLVEEKSYRPYH
ncbi:MAG: tetratricopeptide repeat protein [Planctomycetes bacterium]|nr:tetratricopeptide repeat protein [Planctomycetota bacterium]